MATTPKPDTRELFYLYFPGRIYGNHCERQATLEGLGVSWVQLEAYLFHEFGIGTSTEWQFVFLSYA